MYKWFDFSANDGKICSRWHALLRVTIVKQSRLQAQPRGSVSDVASPCQR